MRRVHALETATLVKLAPGEVLSSVGTRARQTSMGTLMCSSLRDALGADGCIMNGGGIRGSREYRVHVTYGDVKTEVPFDNEVVVARIPGRVLKDAIAASRARAPADCPSFLQVDDRMRVGPGDALLELAGAPLDPDREYAIALVRDLLMGLDDIEPLVRFGREHPDHVPPPDSGREIKVILVDAFSVALWKHLGGFDAVDTNHDGFVTEPEVERAITTAISEPASPITADLVIQALDVDHDHAISRSEAEAADKTRKRGG
jgi:hypothetical protein